MLETYQRWRRFDTLQMGVTTDVLNRLFSNDVGLLARRALLRPRRSSTALPALKDFFIGQAAGMGRGPSPRLLQGEAI